MSCFLGRKRNRVLDAHIKDTSAVENLKEKAASVATMWNWQTRKSYTHIKYALKKCAPYKIGVLQVLWSSCTAAIPSPHPPTDNEGFGNVGAPRDLPCNTFYFLFSLSTNNWNKPLFRGLYMTRLPRPTAWELEVKFVKGTYAQFDILEWHNSTLSLWAYDT